MIPPFLELHNLTGDLARIQSHLSSWIKRLAAGVFLSGHELRSEMDANGNATDGISFTAATQKTIVHKLGKAPQRCFPTRFLAGGATWVESTPADASKIYLTFSANCRVYLWVE